ncbi:MAG: chemotaxis protein CheW [Gemmatimonadaceae bacterium]|nr:chemotaxis protein CheW [Gemmatimonadaceae bacterium]
MQRMLVFSIAGRTRCCELEQVREIVPNMRTTRLPGAPAFVRGLVNHRGTLVTVTDATHCLHGVKADDSMAVILLVERKGRAAGVLVDNVFDIRSLSAAEVEYGAILDLRELVDRALA